MRNKKYFFLVMLVLVVSSWFIGTTFTSNNDQVVTPQGIQKRLTRTGFSLGKIIQMTAGLETWTTVNQVSVWAKGPGYVYVVANGDCNLSVGPNSLTVGVADQPNTNCIWHSSMGTNFKYADMWHTYNCNWVFYVPAKGEYTYYLNACSYYGDGTSTIYVSSGVLSATWIDQRNVTYYDSNLQSNTTID